MDAFLELVKNVGIWAALFIILLIYVFKQNEKREERNKNDAKEREDILRKENNDRELRYISTIDNITEKVYNKIDVIDVKVDKIQKEVSDLKKKEGNRYE